MRLLLDTHIYLWVIGGSRRLKPKARELIKAADAVYVSAATIWEIAIKKRLGKIEVQSEDLLAVLNDSGFLELPVLADHAAAVATLPLHHADPFDRLLVAQAMTEPLRLVTVDNVLAQYSELVLLV